MALRQTHLSVLALAALSLSGGLLALRSLPAAPPQAPVVAALPPATPVAMIGMLQSLRAHAAMESAHAANPAPAAPSLEAANASLSFEPAPQPPRRPADLAGLAPPSPPRRPIEFARLDIPGAGLDAQPPAEAPMKLASLETPKLGLASAALEKAAPEPPTRPHDSPAASPQGRAEPPAAPLTQVARLEEPALKPAPDDAFRKEQTGQQRFGMGAQTFIRIFKQEGELEVWLKRGDRFALYHTYPICKWSGRLGPKTKEADYQSPEGFYSVSAKQLNPHSNYHLAFNVGYPNAFDKQNGHTGGLVMVHGSCKSVGCFAMTDKGIDEIYGFVAAALNAGQKEVPVHIFPFRMTETTLARETGSGGFLAFVANGGGANAQWSGFWRNLKEGYDLFEQTGVPPTTYACGDRYGFGEQTASCRRIAGW